MVEKLPGAVDEEDQATVPHGKAAKLGPASRSAVAQMAVLIDRQCPWWVCTPLDVIAHVYHQESVGNSRRLGQETTEREALLTEGVSAHAQVHASRRERLPHQRHEGVLGIDLVTEDVGVTGKDDLSGPVRRHGNV